MILQNLVVGVILQVLNEFATVTGFFVICGKSRLF